MTEPCGEAASFESLAALAFARGLIPQLAGQPNGTWTLTLWDSGYAEYVQVTYQLTPGGALKLALDLFDRGATKVHDPHQSTCDSTDLAGLLANLLPPEPQRARLTLKRITPGGSGFPNPRPHTGEDE